MDYPWSVRARGLEEQAVYYHPADTCKPEVSFTLWWSGRYVGFGEFRFFYRDGELMIDNECMDKDFIKAMLCKMVDDATLTD